MEMDIREWAQPVGDQVDPEVRAYVSSLVTALGGTSIEEHGRYVLGDDAIAVLKDIRRWIKFYDEKLNRLDVQRILAESNLVKGDLLEILASWTEAQTNNKLKFKVSLGCLELLIPLTWPIEIEDQLMKVNHHRHLPYLRLAQVEYKRAILHHDTAKILRTAVRIGLPSMAAPKNDRTPRDEGIIRLVLYFFRNVALIEQPSDLPSNGEEVEVSRSATIDAFHKQDVFQLLLTVASSMGDEFAKEDVIVLDILFHLLKGINPEKLFQDDQEHAQATGSEFKALLQKENAMLAGYKRHAPTRHNRFGTMVWIKRDNEKVTTVTGQKALAGQDTAFSQMDKSKKWNKPRHRGKQNLDEKDSSQFTKRVSLSSSARKNLRTFVEEFLDSSFNPLFQHLRKAIEREMERIVEETPMQFYYLISWFLQAECARRRSAKERKEKLALVKGKGRLGELAELDEDEAFGLVASVLNQETFVLLNRFLQKGQDNKEWKELSAGMKCFTQILLTVQEMALSPLEEDQEIAENIQNRIFYEESTHDRIIAFLRDYKTQGFAYLDSCTELAHVFIRMLEQYAKENTDLQIRSRQRARRKQRKAAEEDGVVAADPEDVNVEDEIETVQQVSRERRFEFQRFAARFMTQSSINTFIALTTYHADLTPEQLKRAHRFFHRVAFKNHLSTVLFRVDIIQLFHRMIKGPHGLDPQSESFTEWSSLIQQIFRKLIKRLEERPGLMVELLFSKIPSMMFYLENGYDDVKEKKIRAPAELEVKPGMEWDEQLGVAVGVLINQNKSDDINWVKGVLENAKEEREVWQAAEVSRKETARKALEEAGVITNEPVAEDGGDDEGRGWPSIHVKPDTTTRSIALFKDNKLRLLLKLAGLVRIGDIDDEDASWIIPSTLPTDKIEDALKLIGDHQFAPPTYDDDKTAEDFLRSKAAAERTQRVKKAAFDDDSDGPGSLSGGEEFEFEAGGPTARKSDVAKKRKLQRKKTTSASDEDEDALAGSEDEAAAAARKARRAAKKLTDLEKRRKIKSDMYVHSSDEESDEEKDRAFFAREEEQRKNAGRNIMKAVAKAEKEGAREVVGARKRKSTGGTVEKGRGKKRKVTPASDEDEDMLGQRGDVNEKEDEIVEISSEHSSSDSDSDIDPEGESPTISGATTTDTPLSSQPRAASSPAVSTAKSNGDVSMKDAAREREDEDDAPVVRAAVRRRGPFVVESDSE
ncbi:timeless-domain-containing protein [Tothia fuscella]|uniref:Topoisomerase 1-associated factor 1 n=1 Tax=Tothia fuscella TaxID=1048955 RepID=A0A9P4NKB0_9PEZI|nr:timeless-domain-containing protein [Tothia fuscella]